MRTNFFKKISLSKATLAVFIFTLLISAHSYASILIIVNGGSCSGKSTLAKELVLKLNESVDAFNGQWESDSIDQYMIDFYHFKSVSKLTDNPYISKISDIAKDFDPFHFRIKMKLNEGKNVVVDHCFMKDGVFKNALFHFKDQEVLFVKLYVNYDTARERLEHRNQKSNSSEHRTKESLAFHYGEAKLAPTLVNAYEKQTGIRLSCMGLPTHLNKTYDLEIENVNQSNAVDIISSWLSSNSISRGAFYSNHIQLWSQQHQPIETDLETSCYVVRERSSLFDDYPLY